MCSGVKAIFSKLFVFNLENIEESHLKLLESLLYVCMLVKKQGDNFVWKGKSIFKNSVTVWTQFQEVREYS